jgi:hypothetical protein
MATEVEVIDKRDYDGLGSSIGHAPAGKSIAEVLEDLQEAYNDLVGDVNALPLTGTVLATPTEKTIATGAITITGNFHSVDTEADAASDDLDSIAGGTVGQVVVLKAEHDARSVVLKHSATIINPSGEDITLAEDDDYAMLIRHSVTAWLVIAYKTAANAGGGLGAALGSTSASKGASLVGIQDSGTLITATQVEAALAEAFARLLAAPVIADPGNAGAIPVTRSGVCLLTSAGAETRTIAIPSFLGQQIYLVDTVHAGNIVVTASQAINQANNTVMTFGAVRDTVLLTAISIGGALRWQVTSGEATVAFS